MMMNLPCGTASYPFPKPKTVFSDGQLLPHALFASLAHIAQKVLEIDDLFVSNADETVIFQKVLNTDAELREIRDQTPVAWWSIPANSLSVDHVLQYWHSYFTVRTHLVMAMKSGASAQYAYSRSVCTDATRNVAQRYITLRSLIPPGFFAGRIFDLQALTASVFILHSVYSQATPAQSNTGQHEVDLDLIRRVTVQMENAGNQITGDVAKQGSKAIKSMLEHFANPHAAGNRELTLRVPMLGKVHINRKSAGQSQQMQGNIALPQNQASNAGNIPAYYVPSDPNGQYQGTSDVDMANAMGWSMDLLGDYPFMADNPYSGNEPWLWYDDLTTPAQ